MMISLDLKKSSEVRKAADLLLYNWLKMKKKCNSKYFQIFAIENFLLVVLCNPDVKFKNAIFLKFLKL